MGMVKGVLTIAGIGAAVLVGYVVYKNVASQVAAQGCSSVIYQIFYPSQCQDGGSSSTTSGSTLPTTSGSTLPTCDVNKGIVINCIGEGTEKCWVDTDCEIQYAGQ